MPFNADPQRLCFEHCHALHFAIRVCEILLSTITMFMAFAFENVALVAEGTRFTLT